MIYSNLSRNRRKGEPLVVGDTTTLAEIESELVHRYGTLPNLDALQRNVRDITELNEVVPIDQVIFARPPSFPLNYIFS